MLSSDTQHSLFDFSPSFQTTPELPGKKKEREKQREVDTMIKILPNMFIIALSHTLPVPVGFLDLKSNNANNSLTTFVTAADSVAFYRPSSAEETTSLYLYIFSTTYHIVSYEVNLGYRDSQSVLSIYPFQRYEMQFWRG